MKVILNNDIPNLGEEGDVLEVKPGYARNFLIPRGLVSMYSRANVAILEGKRKQIAKRKEDKRLAAASNKVKIEEAKLVFPMPAGENGKLFGAVTAQMIHEELEKIGVEIERKKIEIPGHTLKALGDYKLLVHLYNDEEAELKVSVVSDATEESPASPKAAEPRAVKEEVEEPAGEEEAVAAEASVEEESTEEADQ